MTLLASGAAAQRGGRGPRPFAGHASAPQQSRPVDRPQQDVNTPRQFASPSQTWPPKNGQPQSYAQPQRAGEPGFGREFNPAQGGPSQGYGQVYRRADPSSHGQANGQGQLYDQDSRSVQGSSGSPGLKGSQGQPPGQGQAYGQSGRQSQQNGQFGARPNPQAVMGGQHLSQWMESHRNLSVADQQSALTREPGFSQLPSQQQQRMRDHLTQLNNMSPAERQRALSRTEQMERLSPPQRQQIRGATQQYSSLPPDRRRAVARGFRNLRDLPEDQRQAYLNSPQAHQQYTDQERSTLNNLLTVSPLLPR